LLSPKKVTAMIALDGSWPRNVAILRRIAVQTVVATVASVFLTSIMTVLLVGFDPSRTFSAADLWRIGLSISTIAPALICPLIAFRMSNLMQDLRETHDELANLARKDTLTGLLNRRGFDAAAAEAFAEARSLGRPISALMCDIDAFKALNDQYGHEFGDIALMNVTRMIQLSIRNRAAVLGRQGGDEFAALLPGVDIEGASTIAEGIRVACEARALGLQDRGDPLTISIGVATESPGEAQLRTLLRHADAALYRAKKAGGNLVVPAHQVPAPQKWEITVG
jgi:diguanylate cyclase (GGDEF)-like protein